MKKLLSLTIVTVMLLASLCSCNEKAPNNNDGNIDNNDNNYNQNADDSSSSQGKTPGNNDGNVDGNDNNHNQNADDNNNNDENINNNNNNFDHDVEDGKGSNEQKTDPTTLNYDHHYLYGPLSVATDPFGNVYTHIIEFGMYYLLPNSFDGSLFQSVIYHDFAWAMCYEQSQSDSTEYKITICKFVCGNEATETYTLTCHFENLSKIFFYFYNESEGHIFLWNQSSDGGNVLCLKTNDGGKTWTPIEIEFPEVYDSAEGYPSFVRFVSDDFGIISYTYHVEKHRGEWDDVFDRTYLTTDGGLTWDRISLLSYIPMEWLEWHRVNDLYKSGDSYVLQIGSSHGGCLFKSEDKFNWVELDAK